MEPFWEWELKVKLSVGLKLFGFITPEIVKFNILLELLPVEKQLFDFIFKPFTEIEHPESKLASLTLNKGLFNYKADGNYNSKYPLAIISVVIVI